MAAFTAGASVSAAVAAMLAWDRIENWTVADLARALGCDQRAVWRAMERLRDLGVVDVVRLGDSGLYNVAPNQGGHDASTTDYP